VPAYPADPRLDPARHAGAAAERDQREAGGAAPVQQLGHVVLAGRVGHHVGHMLELPAEGADQVAVGHPVGVDRPVMRVL
jgi:hypothetical protein